MSCIDMQPIRHRVLLMVFVALSTSVGCRAPELESSAAEPIQSDDVSLGDVVDGTVDAPSYEDEDPSGAPEGEEIDETDLNGASDSSTSDDESSSEAETPAENESSSDPAWAWCTTLGFDADREIAETDGSNYAYRAAYGPDDSFDLMEIASYSDWNGPTAPGTYSLEGINYRDCGLCLRIWKGCGEDSCAKSFYASEGLVQIDSVGADGTLFIGSLIGVVFRETSFEADYTSVTVPDGESWCLDGYTFAQEFGVGMTTVEQESVDTDTTTPTGDDEPDESPGDLGDDLVIDTSDDCTLTLRPEVRDESGPCTDCHMGDYITVVGVIENSCAEDLTYQSEKSCLVSEFVVNNLEAGSSAEYPMTCDDSIWSETIASGDRVTRTRPAGRLSSGDYELRIQFENMERSARTLLFTVQ